MKTTSIFYYFLLSFVFSVQFICAQQLKQSSNIIATWISTDKNVKFPFIKNSENPVIADSMNHSLQVNVLGFTVSKYKPSMLEDALAPKGESGTKGIHYDLKSNTAHFLSFHFNFETEGNYPDQYDSYCTFDAQTGKEIVLDSLFTDNGFALTDTLVIRARKDTITNFMEKLDTSDETQREQYELYTKCLESCDEDISGSKWYLSKDTLTVMMSDRCSNHAERAIDDLWDIPVRIHFAKLEPMLSRYGKQLLIGK